ncbi:MAG: hypothetical protein HYS21_13415 [Deltaproteobacteria bacterium]|nr:hypothetical protein [Deltaproteobacteria bacterium]
MARRAQFAVRNFVSNPTVPNKQLQETYDSINLYAWAVAGIPISKILQTPFESLTSSIIKQLRNPPDHIKVHEGLIEALGEFARECGKLTTSDFILKSNDELGNHAVGLRRNLWKLGFRLPIPISDESKKEQVRNRRHKLLKSIIESGAGEMMFTDLFTKTKEEVDPKVVSLVEEALSAEVGFWSFANNSCCKTTEFGDYCVTKRGASCFLVHTPKGPESFVYSLGSTGC